MLVAGTRDERIGLPLTRDLVLVGGGHAHALLLRRWGMNPLPGARLTVVNSDPVTAYSGMLPGYIAGHYRRDEIEIDLVRLARFAGARLVLGRVDHINPEARVLHVAGRGEIEWDITSIDIGVTADLPDIPGFTGHGVAAKPFEQFATRWDRFLSDSAAPAEICIIGAGVAGVELALAIDRRLRAAGREPRIRIVEAARPLSVMRPRPRGILLSALAARGIEVLAGRRVTAIDGVSARLDDGSVIACGLCLSAAGARPQDWLARSGLELHQGYVTVDPFLRSVSHPHVFAAGDCAHLSHAPRPKAGVFAVREAPVLFHNLRAALSGGGMRPYRPQRRYLKLVSLGGKRALADRAPFAAAGTWAWRWKNHIDRQFMEKLNELPQTQAEELPEDAATGLNEELAGGQPLCGGCGSKVGSGALARALSHLGPVVRRDVLSRPGDDAAILRIGGATQVLTTDHLRAMVEDPWLLGRIAATHALGDIWAMGAEPQAALATIILPRMSATLQTRTLREITDAAGACFSEAGAELVGGHTTLGAELTVGFTVTGLAPAPVTLVGARPGDALILTRPLGSGVLLAAEMRGTVPPRAIAMLYAEMVRSQASAGRLLAPVASAMTDVTGFGLAGHLLAICRASGVAARLDPETLPLYHGALDLSRKGVRSTIYTANRDATHPFMSGIKEGPLTDLLFDPQTSGGLLAALPSDQAPEILRNLRGEGYAAACIGHILQGAPEIIRA